MLSPLDPEAVLTGLGDKFLSAVASAVALARQDLADFRAWRPGWFPSMSERGLSNIIHERIWAHLVAATYGHQGIGVRDEGVHREVQVGDGFRLRIKRHREGDRISTYATPAAIEFWTQGHRTLDGENAVTLGAGYRWIADTREIGAPVISYRDGKDNPIWAVELQDPATEGSGPVTWTPITDPSLPSIDLFDASQEREDSGGDQQ